VFRPKTKLTMISVFRT